MGDGQSAGLGAARVPSAAAWHVSPWVDIGAYHFGWLWFLAPMVCFPEGGDARAYLFTAAYCTIFVHRHFGFLYAYLDLASFRRDPYRLSIVPGLLLTCFFCTPLFFDPGVARRLLSWVENAHAAAPARGLIYTLASLQVFWSVRHHFMQKYGIARIYNQKGGSSVPPWVDKLFVLCWLPLYGIHLGGHSEKYAALFFRPVDGTPFARLLGFLGAHQAALIAAGSLFVVVSIGIFLEHERRDRGPRNVPRLSFALGTSLLSLSMLFFDPLTVLLAFLSNHSIEYIFFVTAFLKRRYSLHSGAPKPVIARLLERPRLTYSCLILVLAGIYLVIHSRIIALGQAHVLGVELAGWLFSWSVFVAFAHYYTDSFLWKIRRPEVREAL
jgi:hypothetical protein